jgi:hypothetical protein
MLSGGKMKMKHQIIVKQSANDKIILTPKLDILEAAYWQHRIAELAANINSAATATVMVAK